MKVAIQMTEAPSKVPLVVAAAAAQAMLQVMIEKFQEEGVKPTPEAKQAVSAAVNEVLSRLGWTERELSRAIAEEMIRGLRERFEVAEGEEDEPVPGEVVLPVELTTVSAGPVGVGMYL